MVKIQISGSAEPLNETVITQIVSELDIQFPASYRAFLLKNNGGKPSPNVFPISGDASDTHGILNELCCICRKNSNDLIYKRGVFDGRVPHNLLVIGSDPGGNQICLSVGGNDYGKVYFWDHENEVEEGEEPDYRNVYLVANSFDEFLESLQDESVLESQS